MKTSRMSFYGKENLIYELVVTIGLILELEILSKNYCNSVLYFIATEISL